MRPTPVNGLHWELYHLLLWQQVIVAHRLRLAARRHCLLFLCSARFLQHHRQKLVLVEIDLRRGCPSVSREKPVSRAQRLSPLTLNVPHGTVGLLAFARACLLALVDTVVQRVIFLLLPAVAATTSVLKQAPIHVSLRVLFCLPMRTLVTAIVKHVWLPAIVLPIVGVYAGVALVLFVAEWAPDCLEVKHVEVGVTIKLVENID